MAAKKFFSSSQYGATKDCSGTFNHVTGFGKTFTAIRYIIYPYLKKGMGDRVVILLPLKALVKQWEDEIKSLIPGLKNQILVTTVQTLIANKIEHLDTDLLIVDEIHMFYPPTEGNGVLNFYRYVNGEFIKFKDNLGLSASLKPSHDMEFNGQYKIIDTIEENEAIMNKWISEYVEYCLVLSLNTQDTLHYNQLCDDLEKEFAKFGKRNQFWMINAVLRGQYSNGKFYPGFKWAMSWARKMGWFKGCSEDIDDMWNPNKIIGYAKKAMQLQNNRKEFLYNHPDKIKAVVQIIKKFRGIPFISFSESTRFAEALVLACKKEGINDVIDYHSQMESRTMIDPKTSKPYTYKTGKNAGKPKIFGITALKTMAIEGIKNGRFSGLSTARALDTGFDAKNVRIGIISSASSKNKQQKQRGGRIKRIDPVNPEGKALIIHIVFEYTQDITWHEKSVRNRNSVNYVYDVDDIEFNLPTFSIDDI